MKNKLKIIKLKLMKIYFSMLFYTDPNILMNKNYTLIDILTFLINKKISNFLKIKFK